MPAIVFPEELRLSADGILAAINEAISGLDGELFLLVQSREEDNIKYAVSSGCMPPATTHTERTHVLGVLRMGEAYKRLEHTDSYGYFLPARRWTMRHGWSRKVKKSDYMLHGLSGFFPGSLEEYVLYVGNENVYNAFLNEYGTLGLCTPTMLFSRPGYGPSFCDMALPLGITASDERMPQVFKELIAKRCAECTETITLSRFLRYFKNKTLREATGRHGYWGGSEEAEADRKFLAAICDAEALGILKTLVRRAQLRLSRACLIEATHDRA